MTVFAVTVFESGDMTTSVWGVFDSKEKAEKYEAELMKDVELNSDGHYLVVAISEHKVS